MVEGRISAGHARAILSVSGKEGRIKLAMKTTRDFLNLDIDYYVRVNFFSVKDIVDALGVGLFLSTSPSPRRLRLRP